ncbi:MAG TPA: ubiquinone/menaquinone biosynthesis methyltransferase [bacterium]|nr:ubiquinone/menaquinone biosynthesis methyltransferase [bacterium]
MSKEIQQLFTQIAPSYDFLNHFLSFSVDKRWRDKVVAALGKEAPGRVLDLCAGTLDLTQKILKKFPKTEVFAADFAVAMLEEGRGKVRGLAKAHRIGADGHRLPFAERSFDAVVCAFGIRNLEEREKAAGEIRRVMKPGAKLVVLEFFRPERLFSKLFYRTYGKYVLPRIGGAVSRHRKAYEYLQNSIQHFLSVEEYSRLLLDHGFTRPEVLPLSGGIAHRLAATAG